MVSEAPKTKGAVINGYLKFIKKKWGVTGLEDAMRFAGVDRFPKDAEWVPLEKPEKLLAWIYENKGEKQTTEAGKYATKDLGIFTYILVSLMSMDRFLKRAKETYYTFFNYGEFILEKTDDGAIITLKNSIKNKYSQYSKYSWKGAFMGIMEITGTKGTVEYIEPDSPYDFKYHLKWKRK